MRTEIDDLQDDIYEWQCKTFPKGNGRAKLVGARREIGELLKNPGDWSEWADIMIFFLGAAKSYGHNIDELVRFTKNKMAINKRRKWSKPDRHGVHHHI